MTFNVQFIVFRDEHSNKVKNFMLDILSSIIAESVTLPPGLIDTILENIVSPNKVGLKKIMIHFLVCFTTSNKTIFLTVLTA